MASYVILQVRTRSGLIGYGECNGLSGSDLKETNQALTGKAASAYQALDGLVPATVRGGLNIALLDILGKVTQAPIYRVLGGPTRNKARAITRLSGTTDAELQSDLQKQLATGYRAFLIPIVPPAARNQGSVFVHEAASRLKAMRTAAPEADFAIEARAQLTPGDAASLAAAVERLHPLWFDEPCAVSNLETIRKISEETVVPIQERFRIFCAKAWSICSDRICSLMESPGFAGWLRWPRHTTSTLRRGMRADRLPPRQRSTLPPAYPTSLLLNRRVEMLVRRSATDSLSCRRAQDSASRSTRKCSKGIGSHESTKVSWLGSDDGSRGAWFAYGRGCRRA
jgi:hypothetical protein